jgi:DUF971 family protein
MSDQAWPRDLTFDRTAKMLRVQFDDGASFAIPFELLRVYSPSAEVRGHRESQRIIVTGKENVGVTRAEPVGNYAVRIVFDDGHDSGLYSWALLYELGRDREKKTNEYSLAQMRKS